MRKSLRKKTPLKFNLKSIFKDIEKTIRLGVSGLFFFLSQRYMYLFENDKDH